MAKHSIEKNSKEGKRVKTDDTPKENVNKSKKKIGKIIIFIIFLGIFLYAGIKLCMWLFYNKQSENLIETIVEENFVEDDEEETSNSNPVDFENLQSINSDVVAWIRIEGTSINYPIVQSTDNEYYLQRDINKNYSYCGWIFMDYKNASSFIDKNTVIYGHNMKSGLMFADLQNVLNESLGTEIIIEIYTPTEKLNYMVFSCYKEEPEEYAIKSNIVDDDTLGKYIKEMLKRSEISYNVVPDKSDKLLTLSTCDSTGENRILVHSVYIGGETYKKGE